MGQPPGRDILALPILASTILSSGVSTLYNVPNLTDINHMLSILENLGGKIDYTENCAKIDFTNCNSFYANIESVGKFRGSFFLAAPL
ncbi:MAG: hypothetical protein IKY39_03630, partial [Clostridia bacterium]|nr:hypothetical protein [Clostridia bacterium]